MSRMRSQVSQVEDYPAHLKQCWQEHLQPKAEGALTVISLFAGCGGSSLGYSMAGFRELLAVEWDNNAVEIFRHNFPDVPIYCGDIGELATTELLDRANLQMGDLDILDGSPPCQGFSKAKGKRNTDDKRNQLFREYVRILREIQPKVLIMENVTGLVQGKMKIIFAKILRELKDSGYQVTARVMNTKYFNVPQARQRVIFVGTRNDITTKPTHPGPQNKPMKLKAALYDYPQGLSDGEFTGERLNIAKRIKPHGDGADVIKNHSFGLQRLCWEFPCRTMVAMVGKPHSSFGGGLIHPDENRHLNIAEAKRIMSFPDEFDLVGNFQEQWKRLGNSVPPLFMRAIAKHIKAESELL